MELTEYPTPAGPLLLAASGGRVEMCLWRSAPVAPRAVERLAAMPGLTDTPLLDALRRRLDRLFAGEPIDFRTLPLRPAVGIEADMRQALSLVAPGTTTTYGRLAEMAGHPGAARAIARALARNTLCIIVPCHRVVPVSGSIGGYSGGIDAKRLLLRLEQRTMPGLLPF